MAGLRTLRAPLVRQPTSLITFAVSRAPFSGAFRRLSSPVTCGPAR